MSFSVLRDYLTEMHNDDAIVNQRKQQSTTTTTTKEIYFHRAANLQLVQRSERFGAKWLYARHVPSDTMLMFAPETYSSVAVILFYFAFLAFVCSVPIVGTLFTLLFIAALLYGQFVRYVKVILAAHAFTQKYIQQKQQKRSDNVVKQH